MSPDRPVVALIGEALIDMVARETGVPVGEASTFVKAPGGAVANVAMGLARLGVGARFITKLGLDPFGRFLKSNMEREGIDTSCIFTTSDYNTALVFVALDEDKVPSYTFYGYPSADMMLDEHEVGPECLSGASYLHAGTVSMVTAENRRATLKLVRLAKESGVRFSFDPNLRLHLWKDHQALRSLSLDLAGKADLIKLNTDELSFVTGRDDVEAGATELRELGAEVVVVTDGAKGARFFCEEGEGVVPGFAVEVADTTGAGDGFAAGLLSELSASEWPPSKQTISEAVRFAGAVAARVCTAVGAVSSLPDREQVMRMLSE